MDIGNIPYRSFCWVVGTTSFRTAKLNLRIEQQLLLLNEFYNTYMKTNPRWEWNNATQAEYYDFMKSAGFVGGEALRKDKDAREKTSGLVDIGLIDSERRITQAGNELLDIASQGSFEKDSRFNIGEDSYVYFKQLLKTTITVNNDQVRPYFVMAKALVELGELTYDEFMYLLPLAKTESSTANIIAEIEELREGKAAVEDIIFENLMLMDNYQAAHETFLNNNVTEELICLIGMNRKSRRYDRPYHHLYTEIEAVYLRKEYDRAYDLYLAARNIRHRPGVLWRSLLFRTSNKASIRKHGSEMLNEDSPFFKCESEEKIKRTFFKYLHVFKAMATLGDYFDLNRRYFGLTDTLIFEDQTVRFDIIPRHFFASCIDDIYRDAFVKSDDLEKVVPLESISRGLVFDEEKIYPKVSEELGVSIETAQQATSYIQEERHRRFDLLIEERFSIPVLSELLSCFEERKDDRIEELVTDEADIPTIFEYIVAIIWYKVSEERGAILDFMKLSLDANLLPKSHATGGFADIVYEYEECEAYPAHSLLIEATLADGKNQRRQEMEPVSRHLGEHRIASNNPFDYSLFVSTYLHINVVSDFKHRKEIPYFGADGQHIDGMKIVPLDTQALGRILTNGITYGQLYGVFEESYNSHLRMPEWHETLLREATRSY